MAKNKIIYLKCTEVVADIIKRLQLIMIICPKFPLLSKKIRNK